MKTVLLTALTAFCGTFCAADDRVEDAYDLFSPSGSVSSVWIRVEGDGSNERVSLRMGKNPMKVKDEKGKLMEPDPKFKTEYVILRNSGAEDNRAFYLHGRANVSKDNWKQLVFSFVPRRDGKVTIKIGDGGGYSYDHSTNPSIRYKYRNIAYTFYANAAAKNTVLKDPKFTNPKAWHVPMNWDFRSIKTEVVTEQDAPNLRVLKSLGTLWQIIQVKKDKEVVISLYVRGGDIFNAKPILVDQE